MLKRLGTSKDLSIHIITSIQHLFTACKLKFLLSICKTL